MDRTSVQSSAIRSVGRKDMVLEIQFAAGNIKQYQGVPQSIYTEMINSPSVGKFFNQFIKNNY